MGHVGYDYPIAVLEQRRQASGGSISTEGGAADPVKEKAV